MAARRRERFREVTVARPSLSACGSRIPAGWPWTVTCCDSRWAVTARRCCRCCGVSSKTTRTSGASWARRPSPPAARHLLRELAGTGTVTWAGPCAGQCRAGVQGVWPSPGPWQKKSRLAPSEPLAKLSKPPRPHFQVATVGEWASNFF